MEKLGKTLSSLNLDKYRLIFGQPGSGRNSILKNNLERILNMLKPLKGAGAAEKETLIKHGFTHSCTVWLFSPEKHFKA